jgi:hypothetical protein
MSMEIYVACSNALLPNAEQLQIVAGENGVRLIVSALDWPSQSGFLPMVLEGRDSGAEVDVMTGDDALEAVSAFGLTSPVTVVAMRFGGDLAEGASALAFAGAIAAVTNGRICDPQEGVELTPAEAFKDAKSAIGMLD